MILENIKIIAEICTPFLLFILGILFLRKTEEIKLSQTRNSDFSI